MKVNNRLITNKKKGFTLAEALITLIIIGVIAALTIPGILVNTEQNEYKTALKKALSMLNQAIELNIALDGYGPVETVPMTDKADDEDSLYGMFRRRLNVISVSTQYTGGREANYAFFTADGMRYEFPTTPTATGGDFVDGNYNCAMPGEDVLKDDGSTVDTPCLVIVDVNGERKPNPMRRNKPTDTGYKIPLASSIAADASGKGRAKILDVFPIIITDRNAFPYGLVAQRAMFQHD